MAASAQGISSMMRRTDQRLTSFVSIAEPCSLIEVFSSRSQ